MATVSIQSVRVRNIDLGSSVDAFVSSLVRDSVTKEVSKWLFKTSSAASKNAQFLSMDDVLATSMAQNHGSSVATVTLSSPEVKAKIIQYKSNYNPWIIDDEFNGVTVLHTPLETDIDICTVHGLGGNAFDTWAANKSTMWPRDFLPTRDPFKKSRNMTFGYSSQTTDRANQSGIIQWADYLLAQVGAVRTTVEERQRPIIFVCHSLGGLVVRQAMIRLNAHPKRYSGIRVQNCGILFLGTPHSGTVQADWNAFIDGLLAVGGIRTELLGYLKSFNEFSVESKDAFASIANKPPYYCLHETREVRVAGRNRLIVTRDSAGLNNEVAVGMADVDHMAMCKFEHKFHDGYGLIVERLTRLRETLLNLDEDVEDMQITANIVEIPGHPPITAPRWPLPAGKFRYEGRQLLEKSRLIGRSKEHGELEGMVSQLVDINTDYSAIAISGIGGIGKTELLLDLASRCRPLYNVFYLSAQSSALLEDEYLFIADDLWSDILARNHPKDDRYKIWQALANCEKIKHFKRWLPAQDNTFVLFDDIDGLPENDITDAIPPHAKNIIITTRNPELMAALGRSCELKFRHLEVAEMPEEDMINFLTDSFDALSIDERWRPILTFDQKRAISQLSAGHPLVAARAASYITTELMEQSDPSAIDQFIRNTMAVDLEEWNALLRHKPPLQDSTMEVFAISRRRLSNPNGPAWTLMKILAFLTSEHFHRFVFCSRPWIHEIKDMLNFFDIWSAKRQLPTWMAELRQVSLARRRPECSSLCFHPLILQYIRVIVEPDERTRIIRDIFVLAFESASRLLSQAADPQDETGLLLRAEARHCEAMCRKWQVSMETLDLPVGFFAWLHSDH